MILQLCLAIRKRKILWLRNKVTLIKVSLQTFIPSVVFAIKLLRIRIVVDKVIANEEAAANAKGYTLLPAQRQLCAVAVPLKQVTKLIQKEKRLRLIKK